MTANDPNNTIASILGAPLSPDWTVEGLAEQVLAAIAAQGSEAQEFILDADATADRQSRRLLRPLLACLAAKSAAEAGIPADMYGGRLSFERPGPDGPVWIVGQFDNRPGSVCVTLRRQNSSPPDNREIAQRLRTLTKRQAEVMEMLIAGMSDTEMANKLGVSFTVIEGQRAQIMKKMVAKSVPDLIHMTLLMRESST